MDETITACVAETRYIPLYLPDPSVTELTTFELVQVVAPLVAGVLVLAWFAMLVVIWWKFVEVGRHRILFLEEHEVAHVRRPLARMAS